MGNNAAPILLSYNSGNSGSNDSNVVQSTRNSSKILQSGHIMQPPPTGSFLPAFLMRNIELEEMVSLVHRFYCCLSFTFCGGKLACNKTMWRG